MRELAEMRGQTGKRPPVDAVPEVDVVDAVGVVREAVATRFQPRLRLR
jgi:hypothetical protein